MEKNLEQIVGRLQDVIDSLQSEKDSVRAVALVVIAQEKGEWATSSMTVERSAIAKHIMVAHLARLQTNLVKAIDEAMEDAGGSHEDR